MHKVERQLQLSLDLYRRHSFVMTKLITVLFFYVNVPFSLKYKNIDR